MPGKDGKAGTITPEEFTKLGQLAERYGSTLLAQKVAKICLKIAGNFNHEFPTSTVGAAWLGLGNKITAALGNGTQPITMNAFDFLGSLTAHYGAEVVVQKLGKIAAKAEAMDANSVKGVFPLAARAATARRAT